MKRVRLLIFLVITSLLCAVGGPPGQVSAAKTQPQLAQMAAEQPDALVRVIIQPVAGGQRVKEQVAVLGGKVTKDLRIINAFVAEVTAKAALELSRAGEVRWVSLDAPMENASVPIDISRLKGDYIRAIHANRVWNTGPKYLQGQGLTVAILDSGNCSNNELPCDSLLDAEGSSHVVAAVSMLGSHSLPTDRYGHGSLVEGIVGGTGLGSGGRYFGVAPGVNLASVKVADSEGKALASDVVDGLQWVLENKDTYNIRIANISLNSSVDVSYNTSPLDAACEILWFNGVVVVVSAGNNGSATLYAPANDPFVITVGATDDMGTPTLTDDAIASFSAYGTTEAGFAKPDLVAPGTDVVSMVPKTRTNIWIDHSANRIGSLGADEERFMRVSGTSFAAPMVSGAAALLLQDEPELTPDQVKYRLMATANRNWSGYDPEKGGAGYLDALATVKGATTQSANTGLLPSALLSTGSDPITFGSVGWNSVGWNSVGWNSVGWNSVGWNSVGWNSDYWGP